jgi:hypothetical protein
MEEIGADFNRLFTRHIHGESENSFPGNESIGRGQKTQHRSLHFNVENSVEIKFKVRVKEEETGKPGTSKGCAPGGPSQRKTWSGSPKGDPRTTKNNSNNDDNTCDNHVN